VWPRRGSVNLAAARAEADAGLLGLRIEVAALPNATLARQIIALADATSELHLYGVGRFRAAAVELARRSLEGHAA